MQSPKFPSTPQHQHLLQTLIKQQLQNLNQTSHNQSTEDQQDDLSPHTNNIYFDKQLAHLVITEQFDFEKIAEILSFAFRHDNIHVSEKVCRDRWWELSKNRGRTGEIRERNMEEKRARAVAGFSNPYSLYSVDQLIENLERNEKNQPQKPIHQQTPSTQVSGYTIFSQSFRSIKNHQHHNQLQKRMQKAMQQAQNQIYEQKPMLYMPEYDQSQSFAVKGEELTVERAKKLMTYQIQMEKIGRELAKREEQGQQEKYQSVIKKRMEKEAKQQTGDFQENWDQYQSD